ncbi:MAG: hypothetical protein ABI200_06205 [Gaiellales bacterium]
MTTISSTSAGLPTAASLFATAPGAAPIDQTSTQPLTGPTTFGSGGSTMLPDAAPADFGGVNPTAVLDEPHPQYPGLIQSHVALLQAIGTPEMVIAVLNQEQPDAAYLDRYLQGEVMQNPEGWDDYVGNPRGTTRAGLQRLMPGVQLPGVGAGNPGYLNDGSTVSGINIPGVSTPMIASTGQPAASEAESLIKGIVITAAAVGVGLLTWKFVKNRKAVADVAKSVAQPAVSGGGGAESVNLLGKLRAFGSSAASRAPDAATVGKQLTLDAFAAGGSSAAATVDSIAKGLGPANGYINSAGLSATAFDIPIKQAIDSAKDFRYLDIMEMATKSGQLGEFASASMVARSSLGFGSHVVEGATSNAALREALLNIAKSLPG